MFYSVGISLLSFQGKDSNNVAHQIQIHQKPGRVSKVRKLVCVIDQLLPKCGGGDLLRTRSFLQAEESHTLDG